MFRHVMILASTLCVCLFARAQEEPIPERIDPAVLPIQYTANALDVPSVRVQIRTLAAIAPGKPLVYKLIVSNPTNAPAYRVVVRHPIPKGVNVAVAPEMEPVGQGYEGTTIPKAVAEYRWNFDEFKPGQTKEITVTYKQIDPNASSIRGTAFVSFEHGQAVTTDIEKPKLSVRKFAPETALTGSNVTVRVEVMNHGTVPVADVKLTENNDGEVEYVADGEAEKTTTPGQRVWKLGTLAPGQAKVIQYQVRAKGAVGQLTATSNATGDGVTSSQPAQTFIKLLTAKTTLDLVGPETVEPDGTANYTATVTNTGTMPLSRLRVSAVVPSGCTVTGMTTGYNRDRDRGLLFWDFTPSQDKGPLKPGQSFAVRFKLKCDTVGDKKITVDSDAGRDLEESRSVTTKFQGAASLSQSTELEPGVLNVGQTGMVTYTVTNRGNTPAKNVTLRIEHSNKIDVKQISPSYTANNGVVTFQATDIAANDKVKFSITYTAKQAGRADFDFSLTSENLNSPLKATKAVTIQP